MEPSRSGECHRGRDGRRVAGRLECDKEVSRTLGSGRGDTGNSSLRERSGRRSRQWSGSLCSSSTECRGVRVGVGEGLGEEQDLTFMREEKTVLLLNYGRIMFT